jgi:hypothetical protein
MVLSNKGNFIKTKLKALFILLVIIGSISTTILAVTYTTGNWGTDYFAEDIVSTNHLYIAGIDIEDYVTNLISGGITNSSITASYMVWIDGATYYAQDGSTGGIYSDADASTVIQYAIDNSPAGGLIFFRDGIYADVDVVIDKHGLRLVGSGRGNDGSPQGGTVIDCASGGGGGFDLSATEDRWNIYISDMTFTGGNHADTHGIHSDSMTADKKLVFTIERCFFYGFKASGASGIDITNYEGAIIRDCFFCSPTDAGDSIVLRNNDYYAGNIRIEDCYFWTDSGVTDMDCIHIITSNNKECNNFIISGNQFFNRDYPNYFIHADAASGPIKLIVANNNRMEYACFLRSSGSGYLYNFNIYGNMIDSGTNLAESIEMSAYVRSWNIHDNVLAATSGRTAITDASDQVSYPSKIHDNIFVSGGTYYTPTGSPHTQVYQNSGYITENSGTGTLLSGQTHVHVTHGLSYTPTLDEISITWGENPTNVIADWWIDTIGATEFILNGVDPGASNLDFGWSVR